MLVVPVATPLTRPFAMPISPTVAIAALPAVHVLLVVTSWVEPLLKVAVAVKRALVSAVRYTKPVGRLIVRVSGVGLVTVRLVVADSVPAGSVTLDVTVVSGVTALAERKTRFPAGGVTVARLVLAGKKVTTLVISRFAPLLKVPVAVMRATVPWTRVTSAGVTVKPVSVPPVTLRFVVPLTPFRLAVINVVPCDRVVAEPPVAVIVATLELNEVQVARFVMSTVELLEKIAFAWKLPVDRLRIEGLAGVTVIDLGTGLVAVSTAMLEVTPGKVAVILAVPVAVTAVASPVLLTVATAGALEFQVAPSVVRS